MADMAWLIKGFEALLLVITSGAGVGIWQARRQARREKRMQPVEESKAIAELAGLLTATARTSVDNAVADLARARTEADEARAEARQQAAELSQARAEIQHHNRVIEWLRERLSQLLEVLRAHHIAPPPERSPDPDGARPPNSRPAGVP